MSAVRAFSVMADYIPDLRLLPTLVDFVDMDSAKWRQYGQTHRWPFNWLYRRDGERLLAFERAVAVQALAGEGVVVTGTVDDVRPWLAHAAAVVAPLRIARGIQNKVLEAMAMARPVVASAACAGPITAEPWQELLVAETADDHVARIEFLLADPVHADNIGRAARNRVLASYSWDAHLSMIDPYLETLTP